YRCGEVRCARGRSCRGEHAHYRAVRWHCAQKERRCRRDRCAARRRSQLKSGGGDDRGHVFAGSGRRRSEANITRVTPEQGCEVTLDAYPQQRYPAYVTKIVPTADRAKATVLVKIKFREYDQRVLPEMSAKISFLAAGSSASAAESKSLLTVPATAVTTRDGRQVVFQIKDDRALEVPVTTGQKFAGLLEITAGLKEG